MDPAYLLPQADIVWREQNGNYSPWSARYEDIYGDPRSGAAEKSYVFVNSNDLASRWAGLSGRGSSFCIVETGFGFGLNFLLTVQKWREKDRGKAILHYISVEKHPVSPADLERFYRQPEAPVPPVQGDDGPSVLDTASLDTAWLLTHYPMPARGYHRLHLPGQICLTLIHEDINEALPALAAKVDAWYLDGFKPATNEAIWSPVLFSEMARLSRPGATFSTFSVAGRLRRGASEVGFIIEKQPGFGRKAEMLIGKFRGRWQPASQQQPRVVILGAGLAGLFLARALHRRGVAFDVFDQTGAMSEGSGMHQYAAAPQLSKDAEIYGRFSLNAWLYLHREIGHLSQPSGIVKLADDERGQERLSHLPGYFTPHPDFLAAHHRDATGPGAIFPGAGWYDPLDLKGLWEALAPIRIRTVRDIIPEGTGWLLVDETRQAIQHADHVMIATGAGTPALGPASGLPLFLNKGHSLRLRSPLASGPQSPVLSGPVSLFPQTDGSNTLSGGYDHDLTVSDHAPNPERIDWLLDRMAWMSGGSLMQLKPEILEVRTGWRCSSRDRRPLVGNLDTTRTGLWLCTAFGSHGLTHAPLCAEYLVSRLMGEPWPISRLTAELFASERFAQRDARRRT